MDQNSFVDLLQETSADHDLRQILLSSYFVDTTLD